jgi:hypothetical protein
MERYKLIIQMEDLEDEEVYVDITPHARKRMGKRNIDNNAIYGSILSLGEKLLEMKNNEEFVIIDKFLDEAVVFGIGIEDFDIVVSVITVLPTANVHAKVGQKIIDIDNLL